MNRYVSKTESGSTRLPIEWNRTEWMATIGKKKEEEEEEEEWNDGPSATSKSKKSVVPPDYQFIEALINRP